MEPANPRILTINGGSSSIKFALFEAGDALCRILEGEIERIGRPEASLWVTGLHPTDNFSRPVTAPDQRNAKNAALISPDAGRVKVRVIRTDEALMIARFVARVLNPGSHRKPGP